jgi:hypothetical protein
MTTRPFNQKHGIYIERLIRRSFGFPEQHIDDIYDIPAENNDEFGVPVSIKSTATTTLYLADASRFWENDQPLQMVTARYVPVDNYRVINAIYTHLMPFNNRCRKLLFGNVPAWEVRPLHEAVKTFPAGRHGEARRFIQSALVALENRYGSPPVTLNPKIDCKSQRRLQCSAKLSVFEPFLVRIDTERYRNIKLPLVLNMEDYEGKE